MNESFVQFNSLSAYRNDQVPLVVFQFLSSDAHSNQLLRYLNSKRVILVVGKKNLCVQVSVIDKLCYSSRTLFIRLLHEHRVVSILLLAH